ncbi:MAG: nucleotidyltransferase [Candidatus Cloacimonetes bacterium]|nr:nucleotidyltransferase [Candidatus Cloacimonadota bacterium]
MISKDFREFIQLLNENKVEYLIVGGYALAVYGYPRYTKDLDVWIWIDADNADKMVNIINEFGFGSLDLAKEDFLEEGYVIQLGLPPNRIDILNSLTGVEFRECYNNHQEVIIDGLNIKFIGLDCYKKNKKATGRSQDLADLEILSEK